MIGSPDSNSVVLSDMDVDGMLYADQIEITFPAPVAQTGKSDNAIDWRLRLSELASATLKCDIGALLKWLTRYVQNAHADHPINFTELNLVVTHGGFELMGVAQTEQESSDFLFRGLIQPWQERWVRLQLYELRLFQPFCYPAPLVSAELLRIAAIGLSEANQHKGRPLARLIGCTELVVDLISVAVLHSLAPRGYRLPGLKTARLEDLRMDQETITCIFGRDVDPVRPHHTAIIGVPEVSALHPLAALDEELLERGMAVLESYQRYNKTHPEDPLLLERILQLMSADPSKTTETANVAQQALERRPGFVPALLAEACTHMRTNQLDDARTCFRQLADVAAHAGDRYGELYAALSASRCAPTGHSLEDAARAIGVDDTHRGALRHLTKICAVNEDWDQLVEVRQRQLQLSDNAVERLHHNLALGELFRVHLSRPNQAQRHYFAALQIDPSCEPVLRGLAEACIAADDLEAALEPLARLCTLSSQRNDVDDEIANRLRMAALLEHMKQDKAALEQLEKTRLLRPTEPETLRRIASLLCRMTDPEQALGVLEELADILQDPTEQAAVHRQIAEVHLGPLNDLNSAREEFDRALTLERFPESTTKLITGADTNASASPTTTDPTDQSGWVEVAEALRRQLAADPSPAENVPQRLQLAAILEEKLGKPFEALTAYEELASAAPDQPAVIEALADAYFRHGEWRRAQTHYQNLLHTQSNLPRYELLFRLAVTQEALMEFDKADRAYAQSLALKHDHRPTLSRRAELAMKAGNIGMALKLLNTLSDLISVDEVDELAQVREQLGEVYLQQGDLPRARAYLFAALRLEPRRLRTIQLLRAAAEQLEDFEEAVHLTEQLIHLTSDPVARAGLLHREAELLASKLGDETAAIDCLLRAYDLTTAHHPTLWRLVDYFWSQGDLDSVAQIGDDLQWEHTVASGHSDLRLVRLAIAALFARGERSRAALLLQAVARGHDKNRLIVAELTVATTLTPSHPAFKSTDPVQLVASLVDVIDSGYHIKTAIQRAVETNPDDSALATLATAVRPAE